MQRDTQKASGERLTLDKTGGGENFLESLYWCKGLLIRDLLFLSGPWYMLFPLSRIFSSSYLTLNLKAIPDPLFRTLCYRVQFLTLVLRKVLTAI